MLKPTAPGQSGQELRVSFTIETGKEWGKRQLVYNTEMQHTTPDHPGDCTADPFFCWKEKQNKAIPCNYDNMALFASESAASEENWGNIFHHINTSEAWYKNIYCLFILVMACVAGITDSIYTPFVTIAWASLRIRLQELKKTDAVMRQQPTFPVCVPQVSHAATPRPSSHHATTLFPTHMQLQK